MIVVSVSLGGLFYLYGGQSLHQVLPAEATKINFSPTNETDGSFEIVGKGDTAGWSDKRVNYQIRDKQVFTSMWQMVYGIDTTPVPNVDFDEYEVLAIFDASHSTSGYSLRVNTVQDVEWKRIVDITYIKPGDSCNVSGSSSSPYEFIKVKRSNLVLTHVDQTETKDCK
jgi:hypothetical protein